MDVAELIPDPPARFAYARDPDDARYVDIAIASRAMLIVSNDRDLLDLMEAGSAEGSSLRSEHPSFRVLTPPQFLEVIRSPSESK